MRVCAVVSNILAIDQATKTGYAILNETYDLIEYGIIDGYKHISEKFRSDLDKIKRRKYLRENIEEILDQNQDIIQVVCEGIFKNNTKVFKMLSKIQGSIEDLCIDKNISCFSFDNAGEWRKELGISSREKREIQKQATKEFICNKYPEIPKDLEEDIYDAIGIGVAYLNAINRV